MVGQNRLAARYDGLREFSGGQPTDIVEISSTFADVERIVGALPNSAREYRAWWGNDSMGQAIVWQAAGWRVGSVDLPGGQVVFRRDRLPEVHAQPATARTIATVGRHVFISYSHADAAYVGRLKNHLAVHGLDVWTDEGIDYGAKWSTVIEKSVETCAAFVAVMTPSSRDAPWVNREINLAQEINKQILPLLLDGRPFLSLRDLQFEDVTTGQMPGDRFLVRLRDLTGTPRSGTARTKKEQQFLESLVDETYLSSLERILDVCTANGLRFEWGAAGASIRLPTPDRAEPLSIAWIFRDSGWSGLRHLSLGVDTQSLIATPSVQDLVIEYAEGALTVPGAERAPAVGLRVAIFEPDIVVKAEARLIALITRLVHDVRGRSKSG